MSNRKNKNRKKHKRNMQVAKEAKAKAAADGGEKTATAQQGKQEAIYCINLLHEVASLVFKESAKQGGYENLCQCCSDLIVVEGYTDDVHGETVRLAKTVALQIEEIARIEQERNEKGPLAAPLRGALYGVVNWAGVGLIEKKSGHIRATIYPAMHGEIAMRATRTALAEATIDHIWYAIQYLDTKKEDTRSPASKELTKRIYWDVPASHEEPISALLSALSDCVRVGARIQSPKSSS